jgi:hypothetical protein
MPNSRRHCTCLTHDDLCPSCATFGKAQANHQRFLDRKAHPDEAAPRQRRTVQAAPATPAARLARQRGITEDEAARFLARQAASRAAARWQEPYARRRNV